MRTHVSGAARGLGNLVLSLGLLAGCAASPAAVAHGTADAPVSDRVREERACLRASVGQNDEGFTRLPFDLDRDAYQRCMEAHGYSLTPRGEAVAGERS
jgi:hypothetical protein